MKFLVMMALREVMHRFADGTSMHGIPKVINAKSTLGRLFWSLICVAAGTMFCVNMVELLTRYFSYPKKVTVEVVPTPVPFPAISVCNMRNLDAYVLNKMNRKFLNDSQPYNHILTTKHPFIKEYMKTVAKYAPLFYNYQESFPEVFQEVFSRTTFAANIPREIISSAAVQLKSFIVHCHFTGHACNMTEDFKPFFDPYYFNCYTYDAPHNKDGSLAEGIENGWSSVVLSGDGMLDKNKEIRMLPGIHEWRSAVSNSEGVRVVIHPPATEPYPFTEGYDVPPGFSASFGIRPRKNVRIGPPHGNCSDQNPFGDGGNRYRLMACQKMCLQDHVMRTCGCSDVSLPRVANRKQNNVTLCRNDDEFLESCMFNATQECLDILRRMNDRIQCVRNTKASMTRNTTAMQQCGCFPPCDEIAYDVSYSLSKWPAARYEGDAAYYDIFGIERFTDRFKGGKKRFYENYFHEDNREETMKNFARLNVYIADSNVVKTQESEDYTRNQLVSDIGGQLGLWVGISVITLAEVLELVCELFRYFTTNYTSIPRQDRFISNSESANGRVNHYIAAPQSETQYTPEHGQKSMYTYGGYVDRTTKV